MPRLKPVLTPDQVLVFDYIKQVRSCSRDDMQVALGLTTAKLSAALELFFVVDKIAEVNDVLYFCESPLPVALRNTLAAGVASTEITPAQDRTNKKAIKPNPNFEQVKAVVQDRRRPKDMNEVIELLKGLEGDQYSYLLSPGTDYEATAEQFYNFMEAKGWRIGTSPLKDWRAAVRRYASDGQNHWIVRKYPGMNNAFVALDAERDVMHAAPASVTGYPLTQSQIVPQVEQLPPPPAPVPAPAPALISPQAGMVPFDPSHDWAAEDYRCRRALVEAKYSAIYGAAPSEGAPQEEIEAYTQARNRFVDMVMHDCEHMTYGELSQLDLTNWAAAS